MSEKEGTEIFCSIEKVIMDNDGIHMIVDDEGKRIIVTGKDYDKGDYSEGNFVDIKIKYVDNVPGEWKFGSSFRLPLYAAEKIKQRKPYMEMKKVDLDRVKITVAGIEEIILVKNIDEFANKFVQKFEKEKDILEEFDILMCNFREICPLWNFVGWRFCIMEKPSEEIRKDLVEKYSKKD